MLKVLFNLVKQKNYSVLFNMLFLLVDFI